MNAPAPRRPAPVSARHRQAPREVGNPQPNFFLIRLVKHGPQVPARILHQDGLWWAIIAGKPRAKHADPVHAPDVFRIWHGGDFISGQHYVAAMTSLNASGPDDPRRTPTRPIDLTKLPPLA